MKEKITWLQSLRGMACLIVLFAHIISVNPNIGKYAQGCGKIGVWIFMLFSGMFLVMPYIGKEMEGIDIKSIISFYKRKILKIYPSYIVAIIVSYVCGFIGNIQGIFKHIFLIEGWGHFWFMPVIVKFYIIAPVFLLLLYNFKKKYLEKAEWIFSSFLVCIAMIFIIAFPYNTYVENSIELKWYMPIFMLGMLLPIIMNSIKIEIPYVDIGGVLIAVVMILLPTPLLRELIWNIEPSGFLQNKYLYMGLCWSILIVITAIGKISKHFFESLTFLQKVGEYSFDIYLVHYIILHYLSKFIENWLLKGIFCIVFTFIYAFLMKSFNLWIRKIKILQKTGNIVIICICLLGGYLLTANLENLQEIQNTKENRLYVPTMINKIEDTYFIVDCWHHRVLYSSKLNLDIRKWNQLTDSSYVGGHTICSDGEVIVLDNTDNSAVLVYQKNNSGGYDKKQTIENINGRPHYVLYDDINEYFYVISSTGGKIYVFENRDGYLEIVREEIIEEIEESYVRSISLIDGYLHTVSGPSKIFKYKVLENDFLFESAYEVPAELSGMNQITKIDNYFYLTVNTGATGSVEETTIVRTQNLDNLCQYDYEELYEQFGFVGQPYFITEFDGQYYISEISADCGNGIKRFQVENDIIKDIETVFFWEDVLEESRECYLQGENSVISKEKVDLFLFAGQSNMSGKGKATLAPYVAKGYEYRSISDPTQLYSITEPFGLNENKIDGINDTWENMTVLRKSGGMVSAFANSYYKLTGKPIVGVSCSEGATQILDWLPGTARYNDVLQRAESARSFLNNSDKYYLENTYLVWCQGESDGDIGRSEEEYYQYLKEFTSGLVNSGVVDKCFIIAIGRKGNNPELYEGIRQAQLRLCQESENCILVADEFYGMLESELMIDEYHYSQEGYNRVGEIAGQNTAYFLLKQNNVNN